MLATDFHADPAVARRQEQEWDGGPGPSRSYEALLEKAGFTEVRLSHDLGTTFATAIKPR